MSQRALWLTEAAMSIRRLVGRIAQLYRYPVKSMAGESLDAVEVSWNGMAGDRRWAFVRPDHQAHGFPWQTIREEPRMCLFSARLRDPDRPEASTVDVRTPDGTELAVTDPLLPDLIGSGLRLMRLHRGTFDALPISLISTGTVDALCKDIVDKADPRRFRPNLVVEAEEPFAEDAWVGGTLQIGTTVLRVDKRDSRCAVITVDPVTARATPELLQRVAREGGSSAGVYASVVSPGIVHAGDPVYLHA